MEAKSHQIEAVQKAIPILKSKGFVYIFGQPRVGKSLIALEVAKQCLANNILILTKKMAINDWLKYKDIYDFEVTNYERADKLNPANYDFVIIDEAHNFSAFPKPTKRILTVKALCVNKPVVFLSGTPYVESPNSIYSQLSLSTFTPFKHKNCYEFFKQYGIQDLQWIYGKQIETYKKGRLEDIEKVLHPYVVKVTYEDAGFEYKNEDITHFIECVELEDILEGIAKTGTVAECYYTEEWETSNGHSGIFFTPGGMDKNRIVLENIPEECQAAHQVCGGFYEHLQLPQPKFNWLKEYVKNTSMTERIVVAAYFKREQEELANYFRDKANVTVLSSTKYCEGVDLSMYDHFILYSFGYSGVKFIQLRDRIVNLNNKGKQTYVHIPLIKNCMDSDIYSKVSNKLNFNTSMFRKRYKNEA